MFDPLCRSHGNASGSFSLNRDNGSEFHRLKRFFQRFHLCFDHKISLFIRFRFERFILIMSVRIFLIFRSGKEGMIFEDFGFEGRPFRKNSTVHIAIHQRCAEIIFCGTAVFQCIAGQFCIGFRRDRIRRIFCHSKRRNSEMIRTVFTAFAEFDMIHAGGRIRRDIQRDPAESVAVCRAVHSAERSAVGISHDPGHGNACGGIFRDAVAQHGKCSEFFTRFAQIAFGCDKGVIALFCAVGIHAGTGRVGKIKKSHIVPFFNDRPTPKLIIMYHILFQIGNCYGGDPVCIGRKSFKQNAFHGIKFDFCSGNRFGILQGENGKIAVFPALRHQRHHIGEKKLFVLSSGCVIPGIHKLHLNFIDPGFTGDPHFPEIRTHYTAVVFQTCRHGIFPAGDPGGILSSDTAVKSFGHNKISIAFRHDFIHFHPDFSVQESGIRRQFVNGHVQGINKFGPEQIQNGLFFRREKHHGKRLLQNSPLDPVVSIDPLSSLHSRFQHDLVKSIRFEITADLQNIIAVSGNIRRKIHRGRDGNQFFQIQLGVDP